MRDVGASPEAAENFVGAAQANWLREESASLHRVVRRVGATDKVRLVVSTREASTSLWTAMGAALVGTLLGGAAVWMGLQSRGDRLESSALDSLTGSPSQESGAALAPPPPAVTRPAPLESETIVKPRPGLASAVAGTRDSVVCLSFAGPEGESGFAGAGVIYDSAGHVLTNYHVIEPLLRARPSALSRLGSTSRIKGRFADGKVRDLSLLFDSADEDLAILKLEGISEDTVVPAGFGRSADLQVGETVFSIGCPAGLDHSVSAGIVAALNRTNVMANRHLPTIQLDASINLGNSGGPLFDSTGALVGITSARSSKAQGIGFAIPIDRVRVFLEALYAGDVGRSGVIGATISAAPETAEAVGTQGYGVGLTITEVDTDGPAANAGLKVGDVIVELRERRYDGQRAGQGGRMDFLRDFLTVARNLLPGESLELTIARGGALQKLGVVVQAASDEEQARIDIEGVFGLRFYDRSEPVVLGFLPGSRFEGNRQAQKMLLDRRITLVGSQKVRSIADLGRVASTLKPLTREASGRRVRMRLEKEGSEPLDVTYPLDWQR